MTEKYNPISLPFAITEGLAKEELLFGLDRNFKAIEQFLTLVMRYENITGRPVNTAVDNSGLTPAGILPTSSLSNKLVGLANELQLADESVTSAKLAAAAVLVSKIADEAVEASKIATGAVTSAKLGEGSVLSGKIADAAVIASKLAEQAVGTDHVAPQAITNAKIAPGAISTEQIQAAAVKETQVNWATHLLF